MKITIYTVTDCQFSKQEKEYLTSHQLQYEEKNLETNKDWLTEMLTVSNNFAGTPVTKIDKDDGQIAVLKGFTKEEFDNALGFTTPTPKPVNAETQSVVAAPPPIPQTPTPTLAPPVPTMAMPSPLPEIKPEEVPTVPQMPNVPPPAPMPTQETTLPPTPPVGPEPSVIDPQLNSILNNLQTQANLNPTPTQNTPPAPINPVSVSPTSAIPNVPDFQDK